MNSGLENTPDDFRWRAAKTTRRVAIVNVRTRFSGVTPLAARTKLSLWTTAAPAVLIAWIERESCGRIDKAAHDFNYPADLAPDTQFFVWMPCEQCGRKAKLHFRRELEPPH